MSMNSERLEVRSSRWWALFHFKLTKLIFRDLLVVDGSGIFARKIRFWLTPWTREEDHMQISHIAELEHSHGLIWDSLTIESSGGLSPIEGHGLRKGQTQRFVTQVRQLMGK
jgi:hypothetical protein